MAEETPTERFLYERLQAVSDGDKEFEQDLIETWKQGTKDDFTLLGTAFADKNEKDAVLHSHTIKGSSAQLGCLSVSSVSGKYVKK